MFSFGEAVVRVVERRGWLLPFGARTLLRSGRLLGGGFFSPLLAKCGIKIIRELFRCAGANNGHGKIPRISGD
jgi:hypothetical protein